MLRRRVAPTQLISLELGKQLASLSAAIGRQIGVLINRRGHLEEIFVGAPQRIYLPDIGRVRASAWRLRGLRHIHTVLKRAVPTGSAADDAVSSVLQREDLVDLVKLRLDCVAALSVAADGQAAQLSFAMLAVESDVPTATQQHHLRDLHALQDDFLQRLEAVEQEQERHAARGQPTLAPRAAPGERAMLLGVYPSRAESAWRLQEMRELAQTAGVAVVDTLIQIRARPDSRFAVGVGKLEEAELRALDKEASLIIFDHNLSPTQARAIAAKAALRVIDRTQLILDIFAQHAHSRDGALQVELAQLKYTLPRLTDLDAGLSRLSGGIGGRGPGETKLEINRRRARERMHRLEVAIKRLTSQRHLRRQRRQAGPQKMISIVGYTNAGKSTLLNRLTGSSVLVADQLFATLDPTSRRWRWGATPTLPPLEAILTDTVGFIRDLPADLLQAFRATLEELAGADLLLHVVDVGDAHLLAKIDAVHALLEELQVASIPRLLVLNKSDTTAPYLRDALADKLQGMVVSATTGQGIEALQIAMRQALAEPG